ncbi:MAG TPA: tetratricopeptide repeat protein, partial [Gemmataceae bacterium]|nr:tetratricopeptide repeat protein [Gemmataceae bacterium]
MMEFLNNRLAGGAENAWLLCAGAVLFLLGLAVAVWLRFGRGPRRRRAYRRALRLIHQQSWAEALGAVREIQSLGALSPLWQGRAQNAEGQCHAVAGDMALAEKRYEQSLDHHVTAARRFNLNEAPCRERVLEQMLAEIRRLFASSPGPDTGAVHQLVGRALQLQSSCPEASFWQGLCHVRDGRGDLAVEALRKAREGAALVLDPPLYLGALLLRQGQAQEALRHLSEANRLDANCPFVGWQLGMAIVAAGGDSLAVRALQRALGPAGLPRWARDSQRAWVEGMPEANQSFVGRLASQHPYTCPVMGNDLAAMIRQGQLALAQAQYRLRHFQQAADIYHTILQESPPSAPVVRGLGLSLVRLERYDEAFKHLRAAHEQEQPKDRLTAGYLALCGARGKPLRPEDRASNLHWAIRLVAQFDGAGDREWADLNSAILAEARAAGLPLAVEDQRRVCDLLASVDATDPAAAAAYDQLAATSPESLRPEHAWLYCRAVQQHSISTGQELNLFQRTSQDQPAARAFYAQRQWDFGEVEYLYLERFAARSPGAFPEALGPGYSSRSEA